MMIAIIMAAFFVIFIFEAQTTKGPGIAPGPFHFSIFDQSSLRRFSVRSTAN
jgi:hypothetical protein